MAGSISKASIGIEPKTEVYCFEMVPAAEPTSARLRGYGRSPFGGRLKNGAARK